MADLEIYQAIVAAQEAGEPAALATVTRTRGAVPRRAGSRMLVYPDGRILGTVGGGEMEQRVIRAAQEAMEDGAPRVLAYDFVDPASGDPGVCGGSNEVFVDPLLPDPTVLVVGCGHVGKALAGLAKWLGFRVAVTDDRAEFCTPDYLPGADVYLPAPANEIGRHIRLNRYVYIAAVTRGANVDTEMLPHLLESDVPYIGLIGSRRRWSVTVEALREQGITPEQLARGYYSGWGQQ
ncbi:MAG: XdhC family protein [Anaerolineae bacterium]|nr:XdhC family protein [Anaerolineae bacterium]